MRIRYECVDCDFQTLNERGMLDHKFKESHGFRKRMEFLHDGICYEWGIINQIPRLKLTKPIGTKYITNPELLAEIFSIN